MSFAGHMTTSVFQSPSLPYTRDLVWPRDPAPPPTPLGTDASAGTETTPEAPDLIPPVQTQISVSETDKMWPRFCFNCCKLLCKG